MPQAQANMSPQQKSRLVDTLPSVRTMPMKVIVLGLNRTGTMCTYPLPQRHPLSLPSSIPLSHSPVLTIGSAMFTALKQLGFHPCHGTNMWEDPKKFLTLWTEAMRAKYMGEGEPWGRKELDVVLGNFDVG